jgi:hypothetical protein
LASRRGPSRLSFSTPTGNTTGSVYNTFCKIVNTTVLFYVAQTSRTLPVHILYDEAKKGFFVGKFFLVYFVFRFLETGVIFMKNCAIKEPLNENMFSLLTKMP